MKVKHELEPIYDKNSKILILGSIPSEKSREVGFYYGHPNNRFWNVISTVFHEPTPRSIEDKISLLKRNHIALWDVLSSCDITKSSDSTITNIKVNDISSLLEKTQITTIYTTGKKSYEIYQKYIYKTTKIEAVYLPSTSPANASYSLEKLIQEYQIIND